jgi:hypothetical protein
LPKIASDAMAKIRGRTFHCNTTAASAMKLYCALSMLLISMAHISVEI